MDCSTSWSFTMAPRLRPCCLSSETDDFDDKLVHGRGREKERKGMSRGD